MYYLYGIANCDTVKKAKNHLIEKNIEFEFYDFKKKIVTIDMLKRWKEYLGDWPVNPRGRIFKQLKEQYEKSSEKTKISLMIENTSLIKRPILERGKTVLALGYDLEFYNSL